MSENEDLEHLKERLKNLLDYLIQKFLGKAFAEVFASFVKSKSGRIDIFHYAIETPKQFYEVATSFFGSEEALESFLKVSMRYIIKNHREADELTLNVINALKSDDRKALIKLIELICRKASF
ncbi:MAG: hypothetical protein ACXQTI_04790 [Candidatus Nezhaarchaeales archaeon]